ncbi:MAG: hypothetical protein ACK5YW_10050 [Betaproteobacteria bacterium]|jgi:hypothetical protein|nr:hypothetical protein [Rhodocyclaceae bacterium]MCA3141040.1 hypothetical protein [Rhodocyclaceae bacterium]MCE2898291.1 hypothetical protein [Betaproteobacteria bacterium]
MTETAARRLPGIRFEDRPRTLEAVLPRMDVAGFIGFAARGPLNLPVAIDGPAQFADIFGGAVRLAWDRARSRWVSSHLPGAVQAFFANGGTRCWVARVAHAHASMNLFAMPGIMAARRNGPLWELRPPLARARCEGSWSDGLRIATRLRTRPARVLAARSLGGGELELALTAAPSLNPGDLLRLTSDIDDRQAFAPVTAVQGTDAHGNSIVRAGPAVMCSHPARNPADADPAFFTAAATRADIVTFDLRAQNGKDECHEIDALGFASGHARYWNELATDAQRYGEAGVGGKGLASQRFPVAGDGTVGDGFCFPVDMTGAFGEGNGAEPDNRTALERDGLDRFDDSLFTDPELSGATRATLLEKADYLRYRAPVPRRLTGMHALLGWNRAEVAEEVTLVAVPDAVHRPWQRESSSLPADWFSLERADPRDGGVDELSFSDCNAPLLPRPAWSVAPGFDASTCNLRLRWATGPVHSNLRYRVEESAIGDFAITDFSRSVDESELLVFGREPGEYFYRVRAESQGRAGPWSDTLRIRLPARHEYTIESDAQPAALLPVHRALLTMAAARGDLLAVLALPEDWREDDALEHAGRLAGLEDEDESTVSAGSFAALYHPWTVAPAGGETPVPVPPDGPATGVIARRSRERGAWIAPANEPLRGAVALTPLLLPARWQDLQESRVNVLRREPAGFMALAADTLAAEPELRPIQVRRLLILLRRLALRLGTEFVFEPHGEALRGAVERRFEHALEALFQRGAFAGRRAADAFQVFAGPAINRAVDVDEGRLVVEIRIRPAQALRFMTVRLIQSGSGAAVSEVL